MNIISLLKKIKNKIQLNTVIITSFFYRTKTGLTASLKHASYSTETT